MAPSKRLLARLPNGKLPDRNDFKHFLHDEAGRQRAWRQALAQSQQLADEFAAIVQTGRPIDALSLP